MTWMKLGMEFFDECADAGLSDAAVRTHGEAIGYVYSQENLALTVKKSTMLRWAGSDQAEHAAAELVAKGMWADAGAEWTVVHHANVIRQSLAAQAKKREDDRDRQREKRRNVGSDVGSDVHATQTDIHTDKETNGRRRSSSSAEEQKSGDCTHPLSSALERHRGMCNRCWVNADAHRKAAMS